MSQGRRIALLLALAAAVFILVEIDSFWSGSVDLAHHYALTFRLFENWGLLSDQDPTLGEMNFYPRAAHVLAAIVGIVTNSPLTGINIVTLASLAALWAAVLLIIASLPARRAVHVLATFAVLVVVNRLLVRFDLHGAEIVGNFFYAQLVAQALMYCGVLGAIWVDRRSNAAWAAVFLLVWTMALAFFHLLPALELLALIWASLLAFLVFEQHGSPRRERLRMIALCAAIGIVSVIGIALHPAFVAMRQIAGVDGALNLRSVSYPLGVLVLCVAVLGLSILLFVTWVRNPDRRGTLALRYVALLGAAISGLCVLQYLALLAGYGSPYAVKKYGFALTTLLLVELAMLVGGWLSGRRPAGRVEGWSGRLVAGAVPVLLLMVLFAVVPTSRVLSVARLVETERRLVNLSDTLLPPAEDGRSNVAIGLGGGMPTTDYMFSIAIARTVRDLAVPDVLVSNDLSDLSPYAYVVSARADARFGAGSCESLSPGPLSIVTSACIAERRQRARDCSTGFDFSSSGNVSADMVEGFSTPEPFGRWTDGAEARFECVMKPGAGFSQVRIALMPFVAGSVQSQRLEISLNDVPLGTFEKPGGEGPAGEIVVPWPADIHSDTLVLRFGTPDAVSPAELGMSSDSRKLGFGFQRITFE